MLVFCDWGAKLQSTYSSIVRQKALLTSFLAQVVPASVAHAPEDVPRPGQRKRSEDIAGAIFASATVLGPDPKKEKVAEVALMNMSHGHRGCTRLA